MSAIERRTRLVFYAPTAGRCYMTLAAAARREAAAMIQRKYPTEEEERHEGYVTYPGWHWSEDDRLRRVHQRLVRRIRRAIKAEGR